MPIDYGAIRSELIVFFFPNIHTFLRVKTKVLGLSYHAEQNEATKVYFSRDLGLKLLVGNLGPFQLPLRVKEVGTRTPTPISDLIRKHQMTCIAFLIVGSIQKLTFLIVTQFTLQCRLNFKSVALVHVQDGGYSLYLAPPL